MGVMFLLVVVYWAGDLSRDTYAPYASANLVPVATAEIVTQQTDVASVFLLLRGEMSGMCGEVGTPEVAFQDELAVVKVALENPVPCTSPQTYEARLMLEQEFLLRAPRYVDVNGYPIEMPSWGRVAAVERFSYDESTYGEYPAEIIAGDRSSLVVSIESLANDRTISAWLAATYPEAPVNFAGHYVVLERACDVDVVINAPCWHYVIVDALSGRTVQSLEYEGYPAGYRPDSRLFVVNDPLRSAIPTPEEVRFLVLDNEGMLPALRQIATGVATAYDTSTSSNNE